jgi:hypothetical protein
MARKRVLVVDDLTPVMTALLRESFDVVGIVSDGQAGVSDFPVKKNVHEVRPILPAAA